jgi:hypothetical protein
LAGTSPQPESTQAQVQRWLAQDRPPEKDVSRETSPEPEEEPEPEVTARESDSEEDGGGEPNAALEGDEDEESEGVRTLAELAKRFEVDEETLAKHLRVVGRDGKEVPLHDVLTSYRTPPPEAAEVERTRARLTELEGKEADVMRAAEELRQTAQAFAQQLRAREPDWAALKAADPAAYANARLEWLEHRGQLERAAQQVQAQHARAQAAQQQQLLEFQRAQAQKLQAARPEWSDRKVFEAEVTATEKWLIANGYTAEDIAQVSDHRDWLVADKARRFDELQAKVPKVLAKVGKLPRLMAPGASSGADRGASARGARDEQALMEKFRQSGKQEDAAALIKQRLSQSARRAAGRALASGRRS